MSMTKICVKCKEEKKLLDFRKESSSKDGFRNECKSCRNSYLKNKRRNPDGKFSKAEYSRNKKSRNNIRERNREIVNQLKTSGCSICGYNKCLQALHFHHLENKQSSIGYLVAQGASYDKLIDEIKKCEILCSNCHMEKHYCKNI